MKKGLNLKIVGLETHDLMRVIKIFTFMLDNSEKINNIIKNSGYLEIDNKLQKFFAENGFRDVLVHTDASGNLSIKYEVKTYFPIYVKKVKIKKEARE